MNTYDVIIVGGGVIGCAIAYNLAKQQKNVALIEKGKVGNEASSAAAGLLGVQAEWDAEDPFFALAKQSRAIFPELANELRELTGIDIGYEQKGIYRVAHNELEMQRIKAIMTWQIAAGERFDVLNGAELQRREPSLNPNLVGAVFCKEDGHVLAPKLTEALALGAAKLGVSIYEYADVLKLKKEQNKITGVHTSMGDFQADQVVIATGSFSNHLMEDFGIELFPVKGEVIQLHSYEPILQAPIFNERFYIAPKRGGHILIGSTMHVHDYTKHMTASGVQDILQKAFSLVPKLEQAAYKDHWAGLRPHSTRNRPFIDAHPTICGLYAAVGHYRNGILLSAITGELVAQKMMEEVAR